MPSGLIRGRLNAGARFLVEGRANVLFSRLALHYVTALHRRTWNMCIFFEAVWACTGSFLVCMLEGAGILTLNCLSFCLLLPWLCFGAAQPGI